MRTLFTIVMLSAALAPAACAHRVTLATRTSIGLTAGVPAAKGDSEILPHVDLAVKRSEVILMDLSESDDGDSVMDKAYSTFAAFDLDQGSFATASFRPTSIMQSMALGEAADALAAAEADRLTKSDPAKTEAQIEETEVKAVEAQTAAATADAAAADAKNDELKKLRARLRALRAKLAKQQRERTTIAKFREYQTRLREWEEAASGVPALLRGLPFVGPLLEKLGLDARAPEEIAESHPDDEAAERMESELAADDAFLTRSSR